MNGPGEPRNTWAAAESMGLAEPSGLAADSWGRFDEVVDRVSAVGADHVVTTVEWARLSPRRGVIDEATLSRYGDQLDALRSAGLHPIVRLGSGIVPAWAGEEFWLLPGSPETFVGAMVEVVTALGPKSASWISFSNILPAAVGGWLSGRVPPFRRFAVSDTRLVLDNFLTAHVLLAGELFDRGVLSLGLELPSFGYEFATAVGIGLDAARSATCIEAAVAAARPSNGSLGGALAALNPYGVSDQTPQSLHPVIASVLRRDGTHRWATTAEQRGSKVAATELALDVSASLLERLVPSWLVSLTKSRSLQQRSSRLALSESRSRWFFDDAVTMVHNGVARSSAPSGGRAAYLDLRAKQLGEIVGPIRYTYNALFDGYIDGSFSKRTGLFGIDRARGRTGPQWLDTDVSGDDAATAFRRLAEAVRTSR